MARPFRSAGSYESERVTRSMLGDFLRRRGFENVTDQRKSHGQTIIATSPSGNRLTMRVRLCWVRESGSRDASRVRTYSAAQLTGKIKNDDWEGTVRDKVERERSQNVTHFLFVQREDERIVFAALVPLPELFPIWVAQRDIYDRLIKERRLGRTKKNPAKNGTSPTLYLQNDRAPEVDAALWNHAGVQDLAKLAPILPDRLPDDEANRNGSSDYDEYVPEDGDRRQVVERQIRERRGQQQFRDALRKRYSGRCLVTGCDILAVLEAAHIKPYRGEDDNHVENGLLLRADIHTLFDLDLIGIDPDEMRVELHPDIAAAYGTLAGQKLVRSHDERPSHEALRLRYEQFQLRMHEPV